MRTLVTPALQERKQTLGLHGLPEALALENLLVKERLQRPRIPEESWLSPRPPQASPPPPREAVSPDPPAGGGIRPKSVQISLPKPPPPPGSSVHLPRPLPGRSKDAFWLSRALWTRRLVPPGLSLPLRDIENQVKGSRRMADPDADRPISPPVRTPGSQGSRGNASRNSPSTRVAQDVGARFCRGAEDAAVSHRELRSEVRKGRRIRQGLSSC